MKLLFEIFAFVAYHQIPIQILNILIGYANDNKIPLIINEKVEGGDFPLLSAIDTNNIDTNNIQVTEYNPRLNAENVENHFSESKNIYDQRPQEEVQKESHFSEAQNIYDQKAQEEAKNGNHFSESQNIYDQKAQEEAQKENQIEDNNNNNDNIINDPFIFNTVNQTQNIDIKK